MVIKTQREPFDVNSMLKDLGSEADDTLGSGAGLGLSSRGDEGRGDRRSPLSRPSYNSETVPEAPTAGSVEAILAERQTTHGDFTDNARIMQALKGVVHQSNNWETLSDVQREAIHMILHKIGRICSGNPDIHDHWDDIAGYAKLASERIG